MATESAGEIRIKEYVDRTLSDHCSKNELWQQAHMREHELMGQNLLLAREVLENRLHDLNEWKRVSLEDRARYLTKQEYDTKHQMLENNLLGVTDRNQANLLTAGVQSDGRYLVLEQKLQTNAIWIRNLFVAVGILLLGVILDLILWLTGAR